MFTILFDSLHFSSFTRKSKLETHLPLKSQSQNSKVPAVSRRQSTKNLRQTMVIDDRQTHLRVPAYNLSFFDDKPSLWIVLSFFILLRSLFIVGVIVFVPVDVFVIVDTQMIVNGCSSYIKLLFICHLQRLIAYMIVEHILSFFMFHFKIGKIIPLIKT